MVCKPCGIAGELNKYVFGQHPDELQAFLNDYSSTVVKLHEECKGDTHCDCQHKTGGNHVSG